MESRKRKMGSRDKTRKMLYELDVTQQQFADAIGISQPIVSGYMRGHRITENVAVKINKAYPQYAVEWLTSE